MHQRRDNPGRQPTIEMPCPPDSVPMKRLPERISAAMMLPPSSNNCTCEPATVQLDTALSPLSAQAGAEAR